MLNIPGTALITKKEVLLHEEQKDQELDDNWFHSYRVSVTLPPLTPLLLLEIKHNPDRRHFRTKNGPKRGSKRQKILRFLYDNKCYTCEMSDGQINRFFGFLKDYKKIEKALEFAEKQSKSKKKQKK